MGNIQLFKQQLQNWLDLDFNGFLGELAKPKIKLSLAEEAEWMAYYKKQKDIVEKVNGLIALCDLPEQEIETHHSTQEQWMQSCLREVVQVESTEEPFLPMAAEPSERYGKNKSF